MIKSYGLWAALSLSIAFYATYWHGTLVIKEQELEATQRSLLSRKQLIEGIGMVHHHREVSLWDLVKQQGAFNEDPQATLKAWARKFSIDLKEIKILTENQQTTSQHTYEIAFYAPLDLDVYNWLTSLEHHYFQVQSLGLYRDKVLNTLKGRLVIGQGL